MHEVIVSNIPPAGRVQLAHAAQKLEALPGETYEIRLDGAGVGSLAVVSGSATVDGRNVTFGAPGLVSVKITPKDDSAPSSVRFMVTEQAAVDWIPSKPADPDDRNRRRLVLRALCQAPWFDGSKASMMGRSLAEFGA
jgi:hypothetical protein